MSPADRTAIVVGVDGSQTSTNAAVWAADLAHRLHAPLVIAHALPTPAYYSPNAAVMGAYPLGEPDPESARACLDAARKAVAAEYPDVEPHTWCQRGAADLALIAFSRTARFIVVGAHQNVSIESMLFGTTAARVVNHSECPVVVWRGEPGTGPVVVGVDGSPLSVLAIEQAFALASAYGTGLRAVHSWLPGLGAYIESELEKHEALLSENLSGWAEKYPDVAVERIVAPVSPEESLPLYSADARLVVVGSHGRGRATSLLLGSTSRHLLKHSPCPVLVCRSEIHDLA